MREGREREREVGERTKSRHFILSKANVIDERLRAEQIGKAVLVVAALKKSSLL